MPRLAIVQAGPTQFDGPLFRWLHQSGKLGLKVYFTRTSGTTRAADPELGITPTWNDDITRGYCHIFRSARPFGFLGLAASIIRERHDLIIVAGYTRPLIVFIALLSRLVGLRVGLRADSVQLGRRLGSVKERFKDMVLPSIFRWIFSTGHPTGSLASAYLRRFGFPDDGLFLFPYNVDTEYLYTQSRCTEKTSARRTALGIPADAFVILGVLKFVPREDPLTLVRAFIRLAARHANVFLVLVGDGTLRREVERVAGANLSTRVKLAGYLPYSELPHYFDLASVFVHPAIGEPWGVSVNEALSCGCPVITSDSVGAAADLVVHGETGFCFPAGDDVALAGRIEHLITDGALRSRMRYHAYHMSLRWTYSQTEAHLLRAVSYAKRGAH